MNWKERAIVLTVKELDWNRKSERGSEGRKTKAQPLLPSVHITDRCEASELIGMGTSNCYH